MCELASPAEPLRRGARAFPSLPPVVMLTYDATTEAVTVRVRPVYLDAKSSPITGRFVFAYFVTVANDSPYEVQLLRRRWRIEDASGTVQNVEGVSDADKQKAMAEVERQLNARNEALAENKLTQEDMQVPALAPSPTPSP